MPPVPQEKVGTTLNFSAKGRPTKAPFFMSAYVNELLPDNLLAAWQKAR